MRVYAPGCVGHSALFRVALDQAGDACAGVTAFGVWIPGVNTTDWSALHAQARAETIFLSPELRSGFEAGRVILRPLTYSQTFAAYAREGADLALVQVSPPDRDGFCSLGLAADFTPGVLARARNVIAQINPAMPATRGAMRVPLSRFDAVVEAETPLLTYDAGPVTPVFAAIAGHIAALVRDGDTLQFGLGKTQGAVLNALHSHQNLRIHAGMVSDPILGLLDAGAVAKTDDAVTTGVALGSKALYERCTRDGRVRFADVGFTHAQATLAAIPRLVAINSAIEADLFGQTNAEFLGGRQVSGGGGITDFLRGASLSPGGVPVVALPATAGGISRIVPRLNAGAVTVPRTDAGVFVTEQGAADLRGLALDARAEAMIALAAPQHRRALSDAWDAMRREM